MLPEHVSGFEPSPRLLLRAVSIDFIGFLYEEFISGILWLVVFDIINFAKKYVVYEIRRLI